MGQDKAEGCKKKRGIAGQTREINQKTGKTTKKQGKKSKIKSKRRPGRIELLHVPMPLGLKPSPDTSQNQVGPLAHGGFCRTKPCSGSTKSKRRGGEGKKKQPGHWWFSFSFWSLPIASSFLFVPILPAPALKTIWLCPVPPAVPARTMIGTAALAIFLRWSLGITAKVSQLHCLRNRKWMNNQLETREKLGDLPTATAWINILLVTVKAIKDTLGPTAMGDDGRDISKVNAQQEETGHALDPEEGILPEKCVDHHRCKTRWYAYQYEWEANNISISNNIKQRWTFRISHYEIKGPIPTEMLKVSTLWHSQSHWSCDTQRVGLISLCAWKFHSWPSCIDSLLVQLGKFPRSADGDEQIGLEVFCSNFKALRKMSGGCWSVSQHQLQGFRHLWYAWLKFMHLMRCAYLDLTSFHSCWMIAA